MARQINNLSPRGRIAAIAAAFITLVFLLHLVFPGSDSLLSSTQRWTTASSSVLRSKFLRAKAKAPRPPIHHPIPKLMADARESYDSKVARQSKSLDEAVKEYQRRYKRAPPKGFEIWYEFAVENDAVMIDEYDNLIRDLEPFWQFNGKEIRQRCIDVGYLPSVDLVRISNGTTRTIDVSKGFDDSEVGARAKGFRVMLEKFQKHLPDMDFPINEKAEGRILVPWEEKLYSNLTADSSKGIEHVLGGKFYPDWRGDGNVWESYRRTCDPSSQARRLFGSLRAQLKDGQVPISRLANAGISSQIVDEDFAFSETVDDRFDFCAHPWAHYSQGHFFSDWRTIHALYPMFSPAKGAGYSDIMIPSHYYFSSTKRYTYGWDPVNMEIKDVDDMETPWEEKADDIFWRGATTGGGSTPSGYLAQYQRHRFIKMTSDQSRVNKTVVFADPPGTNNFISASVPIGELNDEMMDAAFTKAVGCIQYPGGCDGMRKDHRFADAIPLGENWRHKYLIDLDGMGYSARLFALLKSESAVLKSTVYTEFMSDWLQPWLHYIPVSQLYNEIYNIHAFFSGPSPSMLAAANTTRDQFQSAGLSTRKLDGDAELQKIARAGREWMFNVGRKIDMEIYVFRLCLEWARLNADDRDAMNYGA
ncbi:Beta-1,2-xylosyltransferase 1 [Vanrija pseudolonga]|uniref:Beta-1,2-xylosyltransferase 1 n=1 Tax=Vanrija pseudolonga TaxID=143232 RepID=A0AAF0YF74_9TREE|nr:Beta-1,2-xylosyltransferase 1 [Vanrija pseudolonga]